MKAIFESTIKRGGYDLTDMLRKIDEYHVEGKLTAYERDELYALARQSPEAHFDCKEEISLLWKAIKELQKNDTSGDDDTVADATAEDWKQPTGAHDAYMMGDLMRYTDGHIYRSLRDGNVWPPDVLPGAWEAVE